MQPMVVSPEKNKRDFAERLDAALRHANIPADRQRLGRLATMFGVSREAARKWLAAESMPDTKRIPDIARLLGVRAEWLLLGQPPMTERDDEEVARESHHRAAETSAVSYVPAVPPLAARADVIDVPVMNAEGSMGYGRLVPEQEAIIDYMRLSLSFLRRRYSITNPANLRIVIGYGDSMAPTIKNGDPVLVDVGVTDLKIDGVYVLSRGDELFIKRMQRLVGGGFEMISDNQLYKPQVIEDLEADGLVVRGRALLAWNGRDL